MIKTIKQTSLKKLWILLVMLLLGAIYLFFIKVDISKISTDSNSFDFSIESTIEQEVHFHIKTNYNQTKLICNQRPVLLDNSKKHDYFYRGEEAIVIPLIRGENRCHAEQMYPDIKQKIDLMDFMVLFLLWGTPLFHLLFFIFLKTMDTIKEFNPSPPLASSSHWKRWSLFLLLVGVIIRIAYFEKFGIMNFQHDWHGHIEFIKYIATQGTLPSIPMKGLEYPQQPLYYLITGAFYALFVEYGLSDAEALHGLGYFSLVCSFLFLYYSYRLIELLSSDRWVQFVAMIFVSLTPSLVYLSARINNDALVMALSVISIYYIVKSYQQGFQGGFFVALTTTTLLFLTKVSAGGVELLFFLLLLIHYYQSPKENRGKIEKQLYIYSLTGILLLSLLLLRVYMPLDESSFYMVNSAKYPNQTIEPLDIGYFTSFNIADLISTGESHVFGKDSIRYSFLTYQYGTMFFGEFNYAYFTNKSEYLHPLMQIILSLGSVYLVGFLAYLVQLRKEPLLHKVLLLVLFINLFLILKFIVMYPSICNTDFRYFVGSFALWAFIFAKGLAYVSFNQLIRNSINTLLALLAVSEVVFFIFLIY